MNGHRFLAGAGANIFLGKKGKRCSVRNRVTGRLYTNTARGIAVEKVPKYEKPYQDVFDYCMLRRPPGRHAVPCSPG
jgi:hypothetical protein